VEQKRVGFGGYLTQLWQRLGRGPRRAMGAGPVDSLTARSPQLRTPVPPAIFAQRERLYVGALQLLDDPQAARQVVAETLHGAALAISQHGAERGVGEPLSSAWVDALSESELGAWLDRSMLRLALLRLRVTPRSLGGSEPLDAAAEDEASGRTSPIDAIADPSGSSLRDSVGQLERIADALSTLPAEIRAVVTLVVMQGRSLPATADLLGLSEEACAFFLGHGRKLLRRTLQRDLVAAEDIVGVGAILLQPRELHDLHGSKKAAARA
jgi:DNA-directed RNA polymerase specialized sigma24 family protein